MDRGLAKGQKMITLHGYKEENLFLIKNNVSKKIHILGRGYTFVFCSLMYAKKCLDLFLCAKNPVAFEHQMDYTKMCSKNHVGLFWQDKS